MAPLSFGFGLFGILAFAGGVLVGCGSGKVGLDAKGRLITTAAASTELLPDGSVLIADRGDHRWVLNPRTGELRADPVVPATVTGPLRFASDREPVGGLLLPRVRVLDRKGSVVARSKAGLDEVFALGFDVRGRAHWVERTKSEGAMTWVRWDPAGREERIVGSDWPYVISSDGERVIVETARFADGAFGILSFGGGRMLLPPLKGKSCDAEFLPDGRVLAIRADNAGFTGDYRALTIVPGTGVWTPLPMRMGR